MSFYQCSDCNRKYKTKPKYEKHTKSHLGQISVSVPTNSRNYSIQPPKKKDVLIECPVSGCRRKYKDEDRVKKHVEQNHFYSTKAIYKYFCFNEDTKIQIYKLASAYVKVLARISKMNESEVLDNIRVCSDKEMISCAKNLLPQNRHNSQEITNDDLIRISLAQHKFAQRMFEDNFIGRCGWDKVMKDFEKFLALGIPYYDTNFCPSLPIDFLWHSLMQDYELYFKICKNKPIPHCIRDRSEEEDDNRYKYFLDVFKHHYKRNVHMPSKDDVAIEPTIHLDMLCQKIELKILNEKQEKEVEEQERKRVEEMRKQEMKEFREKTGCDVKYWFYYTRYYLPFYKQGLTGMELKKAVSKKMNMIEYSVGGGSC